jgi:hypothetical protein
MIQAGLRSLTLSIPSVGCTFHSLLREAGVWSRVSGARADRKCCEGWLIADVCATSVICLLT